MTKEEIVIPSIDEVGILKKRCEAPSNCNIISDCCEDLMIVIVDNSRVYAIGSIDIINGRAFFNPSEVFEKDILDTIDYLLDEGKVGLTLTNEII
jgi:hypothetical protein